MKDEFIRTEKTNLTDNELILFDAIFDSNCSIEQLKRHGFDERFNFAYQHSLNNKDLIDCLENLQSRNLIKIKGFAEDEIDTKYINLTAKGGKLWEKEREPIWGKYCGDWLYWPLKSGNKMLWEIVSPSSQTLKNYLEAVKKLKLNNLSKNHEISFFTEKRKFIVGLNWKRFDELHFATIIGVYSDSSVDDWNKYYEYLDWWRTVHELNVLKQNIG